MRCHVTEDRALNFREEVVWAEGAAYESPNSPEHLVGDPEPLKTAIWPTAGL